MCSSWILRAASWSATKRPPASWISTTVCASTPRAASSGEDQRTLRAAHSSTAATAAGEESRTATLLTVTRPSGADPFLDEVGALRGSGRELESRFHGCLAYAIDPTHHAAVSTRGMEALYGLTPAEAEVLRLMLEGHPTEILGEMRGVSPHTIRAQIKSPLAKTRTAGRPQLVRLALHVNLPVDPPGDASRA